jgi:hypothetical protein
LTVRIFWFYAKMIFLELLNEKGKTDGVDLLRFLREKGGVRDSLTF